MDDIETFFLCQGCQTAEEVALRLADFFRTARKSIDIAIYSFSLCPESRQIVHDALHEQMRAGVRVRIAYDDKAGKDSTYGPGPLGDYCDYNTPSFVGTLGLPSRAVSGSRALMHHKYVIIDAGTPEARVWTGSLNWTDDGWEKQENNVIIVRSQQLAEYYRHDFEELWVDGNLAPSGTMDSGEDTVRYRGEPAHVLVNFSPGEGEWIDEAIANQIDRTEHKATLAFVVLTSSRILRAVQGLMMRNVPINGIYDEAQMEGVKYQWSLVPANHWKIPAFEEIIRYAQLVGKKSTPYTENSPHDFMHNKIMVLDDVVITGSYNFSRHAQQNAENSLIIKSAALAETYNEYLESLMDKYRLTGPTKPSAVSKELVSPEAAEAK
ncbi:MAG: phospholipase D-like domain-containing protein [Chloroflexota bacterium]|nr:phospholipase D-like domain-containing protein [Chloroflexota bacterium]MDQ5866265.1 phospholipase D-like domain-containing protein [Chloroflexota bacterium]